MGIIKLKYSFSFSAGRIYDFIYFPIVESRIKTRIKEFGEGYEKFFQPLFEFKRSLGNEWDELLEFYQDTNFIFVSLIKYLNIFEYKNEIEYLEAFSEIDENTLQELFYDSVIYNTLGINQEKNSEEYERAKEKINNNGIIDFISDCNISSSSKWNIIKASENLPKTRIKYINLMNGILQKFLEGYMPYEKQINTYGEDLVSRINDNGESVIMNFREGVYTYRENLAEFIRKKCNKVIVPLFSALSLFEFYYDSDLNNIDKNFLCIGLRIEEGLSHLKQRYKDARARQFFMFKILGDEKRFEIFNLISQGVGNNKELAKRCNLTTATVSYHLGNLINANLIIEDSTQKGKCFVVDKDSIKNELRGFLKNLDIDLTQGE